MESPRKFNDCYFYYYSTCTKGDNCVFRHEPSALGCETMCTAWQQGKCLDKRCKLRHMELRKNRKQIPCYWENQPGGCRKIHCPFMHKNPDARTDGIAPSQPLAPVAPGGPVPVHGEGVGGEPQLTAVPAPPPVPAPVPLLWQQQRQEHLPPVVLDSTMLGVLPASSDLRRMLTPHAHEAPNPYAQLPVDPLVVNFEEESDNESAPSSTPTKAGSPEEAHTIARTKSQELLLLEKIQAEAAAFYNYHALPPVADTKDKKIVRTNLNTKYERLSLDEIAGKKQATQERRTSLDFKVLSLDEIRARKKPDTIIPHNPQITLNLRKRKLSTQETVTTSGNKIIKVVRSNSIVYKKLDKNAPPTSTQTKVQKPNNSENARKRTISEQSDVYEIQDDELVDNCYEFKRIKITEQIIQNKPRLIRNRNSESKTSECETTVSHEELNLNDNDSDNEIQIVSVENLSDNIDLDKIYTDDIIDVETSTFGEPIDIVDLSDDDEHTELITNVPDVVASCQKPNKIDQNSEKNVLKDIDAFLNNDL